jgi:hypothetical protein
MNYADIGVLKNKDMRRVYGVHKWVYVLAGLVVCGYREGLSPWTPGIQGLAIFGGGEAFGRCSIAVVPSC